MPRSHLRSVLQISNGLCRLLGSPPIQVLHLESVASRTLPSDAIVSFRIGSDGGTRFLDLATFVEVLLRRSTRDIQAVSLLP